jgi:DNA ligase 1
MNDFDHLAMMVSKLQATSSSTEKKNIIAQYPQCKQYLRYTYDSFKNYFLTSDNVKKQRQSLQFQGPSLFGSTSTSQGGVTFNTVFDLLDALSTRKITGYDGVKAVLSFISKNRVYEELVYGMIDKDLKCRIDAKVINKVYPGLIPTFNVALANSYWDIQDKVDFDKDIWFASRKLDGCRLLTVVDELGVVTCYSRNGKEFGTLQRIKDEIKEVWPELRSVVFDGEICIVDEDGNEHFDWVMKEINKKNHTIAQPRYRVFDYLSLENFSSEKSTIPLSKRFILLDVMMKKFGTSKLIFPLIQTIIQTKKQAEAIFEQSQREGWEGIILRKDAPYQGKRSNDMLKMKAFHDDEYTVIDVEFGPFQIVKNGKETTETVLTKVFIAHKGYRVGVGSGFTIDERRRFCKHPEDIKGKTIKVSYFEETTNKNGTHSLRFPTIKCIYSDGRFD